MTISSKMCDELIIDVVPLRGLSRLLLRPHGRSEGRVERVRFRDYQLWAHYRDKTLQYSHDTRAQAAQAAYDE